MAARFTARRSPAPDHLRRHPGLGIGSSLAGAVGADVGSRDVRVGPAHLLWPPLPSPAP
ncbi:hypothetical protein ACQP1W_23515 [Spirillospora sp. CA-255316]